MFSGPRRANGVQGLRFIIQSEKAPHYLESRVEAFLCTMEKAVEEMSEEAFQKHIQALAIRRLDKPKKLSAECAKHWGEIISQQYHFERGDLQLHLNPAHQENVDVIRACLHVLWSLEGQVAVSDMSRWTVGQRDVAGSCTS